MQKINIHTVTSLKYKFTIHQIL